MPKIRTVSGGPFTHMFFCPACKCGHGINTEPNKSNGRNCSASIWTFNGDMEKPTIRASILTKNVQNPPEDPNTGDFARDEKGNYLLGADGRLKGAKDIVCHSFVTDGKIQFLSDCTHELRDKIVDLEDF